MYIMLLFEFLLISSVDTCGVQKLIFYRISSGLGGCNAGIPLHEQPLSNHVIEKQSISLLLSSSVGPALLMLVAVLILSAVLLLAIQLLCVSVQCLSHCKTCKPKQED